MSTTTTGAGALDDSGGASSSGGSTGSTNSTGSASSSGEPHDGSGGTSSPSGSTTAESTTGDHGSTGSTTADHGSTGYDHGPLCTQEYHAVCGKDGETYDHPCSAAAAGVEIRHDGPCFGDCEGSCVVAPQGPSLLALVLVVLAFVRPRVPTCRQ